MNWVGSSISIGGKASSVGGMRSPSGTPGSSGGTGFSKLPPLLCCAAVASPAGPSPAAEVVGAGEAGLWDEDLAATAEAEAETAAAVDATLPATYCGSPSGAFVQ